MSQITDQPAIERALLNIGGPSAAGRAMGISPQAVGQWERVPAERVLEVERLSGVPRYELRPDLYPPAEYAADQVGGA